MCLACSTPVRGRAFGSECLSSVLGPDAPTPVERDEVRPDRAIRVVTALAFGVAVVATALPWSRFGPGSGVFGAWTRAGHWSLLAAAAAGAGLVLAIVALRRTGASSKRDLACAVLGGSIVVASALSVMFPPAFSSPWLGPWVALMSGLIACGASVLAVRSPEKDTADI
jgi:hypothetical protein